MPKCLTNFKVAKLNAMLSMYSDESFVISDTRSKVLNNSVMVGKGCQTHEGSKLWTWLYLFALHPDNVLQRLHQVCC